MRSERTKACDIPKKVKDKVWERDGERCIRCGRHDAMPNAHYIPRSKNGLGIEENVVTLCMDCHRLYDQSTMREEIGEFIADYLRGKYPGWDEINKIYSNWG